MYTARTKCRGVSLTIFLLLMVFVIGACRTPLEDVSQELPTATAVLLTPENQPYSCADIEDHWGRNWTAVLAALDSLLDQNQTCGHWDGALSLQNRIDTYARNSGKPILLEEIGYHSWQEAPQDKRSEETQANLLDDAMTVAESEEIAGWVIWTAFDFVPQPGRSASFEHHFGLWRSDLSPKPALSRLVEE